MIPSVSFLIFSIILSRLLVTFEVNIFIETWYMLDYDWLALLYGRKHHSIVKQFSSN